MIDKINGNGRRERLTVTVVANVHHVLVFLVRSGGLES